MSIASAQIDTWLAAGVAIMKLGELSSRRLDLEIQLIGGQIRAGYLGEERVRIGTYGCDTTVYDWEEALRLISAIPQKEGVYA